MNPVHYKLNSHVRTHALHSLAGRQQFLTGSPEQLLQRIRRSGPETDGADALPINTVELLQWARRVGQHAKVRLPTTRIATLASHAGGVGKTSITREVAYAFWATGLRVLLIDTDSQANLTSWMGQRPNTISSEQTITAAVLSTNPTLPTPIQIQPGLDLIPANRKISQLADKTSIKEFTNLRRAILAQPGYDLILIDSPVGITGLGRIATITGDEIIVVMTPTEKSLEGLEGIEDSLSNLQLFNPGLKVGAVIINRYDRSTINDTTMLRQIQKRLNHYPIFGPIPRATAFDVAQLNHKPVAVTKSTLAQSIYAVADGLLEHWNAELEWTGELA